MGAVPLVLLVLALVGQPAGPLAHSPAGSPALSPAGPLVSAPEPMPDPEILLLVELVNRRRSEVGCSALTWHEGIASVARAHSLDMQNREFYDHVNPDGESLSHRLVRAGIGYNGVAGENLVIGTVDGRIAFTLWMESPAHRANIEECAFTHHGVGLADGRWTHVFVQRPFR